MKKKAPEGQWRRLDNTAKIFPVIANENMSQVFRISVTLKEEIQPEALQQALEDILPHIRNFRVRLRQGLFWYYFEENGLAVKRNWKLIGEDYYYFLPMRSYGDGCAGSWRLSGRL